MGKRREKKRCEILETAERHQSERAQDLWRPGGVGLKTHTYFTGGNSSCS